MYRLCKRAVWHTEVVSSGNCYADRLELDSAIPSHNVERK